MQKIKFVMNTKGAIVWLTGLSGAGKTTIAQRLRDIISPYRAVRDEVKSSSHNFIEVYVNAPIEVCELRDVKGLYAAARSGKLKGFTGVDDPYEVPLEPDVTCFSDREAIEESVWKIVSVLDDRLG